MNDFDHLMYDAFTERADGAPTERPPFDDLLARRQSTLRRRSAAATAGIVALGLTGLMTLGVDDSAVPGQSDGSAAVPLSDGQLRPAPDSDVLWYCEGAVGGSIVPTDDSGWFRHCERVRPDIDRSPTTTMIEIVAVPPITDPAGNVVPSERGEQEYVIQAGDFPIGIADLFCVELDALLNYNNFESADVWPFPGEVLRIPPGGCARPGEPTLHTRASTVDVPATTTTSLLGE